MEPSRGFGLRLIFDTGCIVCRTQTLFSCKSRCWVIVSRIDCNSFTRTYLELAKVFSTTQSHTNTQKDIPHLVNAFDRAVFKNIACISKFQDQESRFCRENLRFWCSRQWAYYSLPRIIRFFFHFQLTVSACCRASFCHSCKNYTLTFNNIFFQFSKEQLYKFKIYVSQIDVNY